MGSHLSLPPSAHPHEVGAPARNTVEVWDRNSDSWDRVLFTWNGYVKSCWQSDDGLWATTIEWLDV